jgi:hypothetical protein
MDQSKTGFDADRKKVIRVRLIILAVWLISISCKRTNPISGLADALKDMFESIGRSITINF